MALWGTRAADSCVFVHRPASWVAVFNAMPTICFGFQVPVARFLSSSQLAPHPGLEPTYREDGDILGGKTEPGP